MSLTDADVEWVMAAPKEVAEPIIWRPWRANAGGHRCRFAVRVPSRDDSGPDEFAMVEATYNAFKARCAFVFRDICIRRWESRGFHPNPDGRVILGQHKHGWNERSGDRYAYVPDDIDAASRDTMIMSFLAECAIAVGAAGEDGT